MMTKNLSEELQRNARQALAGLQPAASGEEAGGLPLLRLLAAFFRARYLILGTTLLGLLVGLFVAIVTPNNYLSTGKFLFTSTGAEATLLDATQATETSADTLETAATYILDSDDLRRRVISRLGPERILQPYSPGDGTATGAKALFFKIQHDWNMVDASKLTEDEALKHLQRTVKVERPRFTNVLIATCDANDNELAQEILSTYMDEAVKWHIEKYDNKKAYEEAKAAYEASVGELATTNREMREFLDRKALVSDFDAHKQRVQAAEIESQTRLTALRNDILIKQGQLRRVREQLADPEKLPPTRVRKVRAGASTEELAEMRTRLASARIKLRESRRLYSDPQNIDILAAERNVESIEQAIKDMKAERVAGELVDEVYENPLYASTLEDRDTFERDLIGLAAQRDQAEALHAENAKELRRMLSLEPEYDDLYAKVVLAGEEKEHAQSTWAGAQRKRALGIGNYSSLKPFQEATLPLEKEGPNRGKSLLGGLLVGLFLGIGIVILRALLDSTVRTRDDLEQIDDLAVIGVMPRLDRTNVRRHMAMRERGW